MELPIHYQVILGLNHKQVSICMWIQIWWHNTTLRKLYSVGCGVASIWVLKHNIYAWRRSALSLKWVKWVGCTNHNLTQHDTSEKPSESPTTTTVTVRPSISGWGCIYMIASRSSTFWITLYMHDKEVLWVWGGWGAPIITLHMLQVIVQDKRQSPTASETGRKSNIMLGLHPYDH